MALFRQTLKCQHYYDSVQPRGEYSEYEPPALRPPPPAS